MLCFMFDRVNMDLLSCFLLFYYLLLKTVLLDYPFVMRWVSAVAHYRITRPKGKVLLRFFPLAFSFSPDGYPCRPAPLNGAGRPLPQGPHKRLHRTDKSLHLRGPLAVCFLSNQPQASGTILACPWMALKGIPLSWSGCFCALYFSVFPAEKDISSLTAKPETSQPSSRCTEQLPDTWTSL